MPGPFRPQLIGFIDSYNVAPGAIPPSIGKFNPVIYDSGSRRKQMRDTVWLIVAIVAGVLAVVGWVARERWLIRRRRGR